jgi:hypothetical protein
MISHPRMMNRAGDATANSNSSEEEGVEEASAANFVSSVFQTKMRGGVEAGG